MCLLWKNSRRTKSPRRSCSNNASNFAVVYLLRVFRGQPFCNHCPRAGRWFVTHGLQCLLIPGNQRHDFWGIILQFRKCQEFREVDCPIGGIGKTRNFPNSGCSVLGISQKSVSVFRERGAFHLAIAGKIFSEGQACFHIPNPDHAIPAASR